MTTDSKKVHARKEQTDKAIGDALLKLLKTKRLSSITMNELAKEAQKSRSTLYQHFNNVNEVYEMLIDQFISGLDSIENQLSCSKDISDQSAGIPFCIAIKTSEHFAPLFKEDRFLSDYLTRIGNLKNGGLNSKVFRNLAEQGCSNVEIFAIYIFQISGCFNLARNPYISEDDWVEAKAAVDIFIEGGLNALKEARFT